MLPAKNLQQINDM